MLTAALWLASTLADPVSADPTRDVSVETGLATAAATGLCYGAGVASYQLLFGEAVIEGGLHPLMIWTLGTPTLTVGCGAVIAFVTPMVLGEAPTPWALAGSVGGGVLGAMALGAPGAIWLLSSSAAENSSLQSWALVIGAGVGFAAGAGVGAGLGQAYSD